MGNSTKELVNAFNLNNYFSDKINANFTVEGKKIVGLFASSTNIGEYLRRIEEEIIERHYLSGTEVARKYYNLDCFPFVLGANADKEDLGNGIVKVKLADSTDPAVIHNLKINFANEFERAVISKVVARLQKAGVTEEEAYKWIRGTVGTGAIGMPYLYCIAFSDGYLYDSETFEIVKAMYIQEFNSRLKECHVKSSDFYEYKDDMLYIKDVSDKVVKSVTEYVKKEVALDFRTPGSVESKVENCKNVLNDLIFKSTGKSIYGYDYDDFIDKNKIKNGHSFALIPLDNQYETLSFNDARNINRVFNKEIPSGFINGNFISDIKGKTANPQFANCKEPVYAFSNKQIALLLPKIMESPIAYNQISGCFEFAVDLTNFKRRGSSRSSSTVTSPTHAGQSGLRTLPNQRKADSGYDSNSPPKPKDSVAHSPSGDPGPSSKISHSQVSPPRQGSILRHDVGAAEVGAAANMPAWTSASFQPMDRWSLPVFYAQSSDISVPRFQPPTQLSSSGPSSSKGANPVGTNPWSQPMGHWSSSKGADKSVRTTWYVSSPLTTRNDSMSSSLGVFANSPSVKGKESIFSVEPEKQQVTDKSDRESSDECSEAQSQESESPKKYLDVLTSGIKSFFSSPSKPKQHDASLKRCDVGRDTMHSSVSAPGDFVTEKPPLSERSASERRAKSNPPSKETSPVHSTISGSIPGLPSQGTTVVESNSGLKSQKRLDPDQREELRPFLSPELKKKLDSNSFSPGEEQHLYLTHTLSGKWEITKSFESPEENLRRCVNAQLPSSDNLSSKKVNRDSGFCSIGSASPAVPHKGSVSSELKHPQQVKHMSEALGK